MLNLDNNHNIGQRPTAFSQLKLSNSPLNQSLSQSSNPNAIKVLQPNFYSVIQGLLMGSHHILKGRLTKNAIDVAKLLDPSTDTSLESFTKTNRLNNFSEDVNPLSLISKTQSNQSAFDNQNIEQANLNKPNSIQDILEKNLAAFLTQTAKNNTSTTGKNLKLPPQSGQDRVHWQNAILQQTFPYIYKVFDKGLNFSSKTAEGPEGFSADTTLFNAFSNLVTSAQLQTQLHQAALGLAPIFFVASIYDLYKDVKNTKHLSNKLKELCELEDKITNWLNELNSQAQAIIKTVKLTKLDCKNLESITFMQQLLSCQKIYMHAQVTILKSQRLTEALRSTVDVSNIMGALLASVYSIGVLLPAQAKAHVMNTAYQTTLSVNSEQIYHNYGQALQDYFQSVNEASDLLSTATQIGLASSSCLVISQIVGIATGIMDYKTGKKKQSYTQHQIDLLKHLPYQLYLEQIKQTFNQQIDPLKLWQSTYNDLNYLQKREIVIIKEYLAQYQKLDKHKHKISGLTLASGSSLTLSASALFILSVIFYPIAIGVFSMGTLLNIAAMSVKYRATKRQKKLLGKQQFLEINYTNFYQKTDTANQEKPIDLDVPCTYINDFLIQLKYLSIICTCKNTLSKKSSQLLHINITQKINNLRNKGFTWQGNNTSLLNQTLVIFKFEHIRKTIKLLPYKDRLIQLNHIINKLNVLYNKHKNLEKTLNNLQTLVLELQQQSNINENDFNLIWQDLLSLCETNAELLGVVLSYIQSLKLTEEQQNLAYGQKNENIQNFLFKVFAADNAKDLFLKIHATHRKFYMKALNKCDEALNFNKGYLSTHFLSVSEEDWQICLNHNKVQAILLACLKKQTKYDRSNAIATRLETLGIVAHFN